MVGGEFGERVSRNGKAPIERDDDSSALAVITSSDSDCAVSVDAVQSRVDAKFKSAAIDLTVERRNEHVNDDELARLLSMFPNASPWAAAADLASQMTKTSPGKALERIIHRYVEYGVPNEEQGPQPDPPQAIEKPTDVFARPSVHGVGTSNHGEQQADFGYELLPPEITANYNHWTYYTLAKEFPRYPVPELRRVLEENNNWFAPSYKAISSDYAAALAAELRGQGRKRKGRQEYPKLNVLPHDPTPKPQEPCYIFERELQSIRNASAEGAEPVTEELKIDTGPLYCKPRRPGVAWESETSSADTECGCFAQCGTGMDACEGEASVDNEGSRYPQYATHMEFRVGETSVRLPWGWCCCSADDQTEELVQFGDGPLLCYSCLGRIIVESDTSSGSEASYPNVDSSDCEESFPGSGVETFSSDDAVVPDLY